MPRLSLYRPEKGNDYKFIDKSVWEMFQIGGTDVLVHKYIGPGTATQGATPSTPDYGISNETHIQDLLFLENRDRKYDPDIYLLRGVYNLADIDFNLSQFGLFLQNDTIFMTFHINDTVEKIGRKIMSGDVIELPHLKDEHALNNLQFALKRFYVVEEVNRAAEGFSVTWYPHLYRAKCKPLVDSQEFKQILDGVAEEGSNTTLREVMSTYETEMKITAGVLDQAEADAPKSGFDNTQFYHLQRGPDGNPQLITVDSETIHSQNEVLYDPDDPYWMTQEGQTQAIDENGDPLFTVDDNGNRIPVYSGVTAAQTYRSIERGGYGEIRGSSDAWLDDAIPANGARFTAGIAFPATPQEGQFCLRTDYLPTRLFRYSGTRWIKIEDNVRMTMNNLGASDVGTGDRFAGKDVRQTQKADFVNNTKTTTINGKVVKERQSLSKALRPEADE
jgi:hypothetical protein